MKILNERSGVPIIKDTEDEGPIPSAWRPVLRQIVNAFVLHDYCLSDGVPGVAPVSEETAAQIERHIKNYGATLIQLPKESWNTSVCIWMGDRWDALIDLWTAEEGSSDLVLQVRISEISDGYVMTVYMVYVP
ncbi:hypothetical protein KIV45_19185 [Janthinobacterium lividum]|nr:hypothetical protein KIV45_19185 [Janthinobacterium lividum]